MLSNKESLYSFKLDKQFKFNSAHFITFDDFREKLHGHNYKVSLIASSKNINFIKDKNKLVFELEKICKSIHGKLILPLNNTSLTINTNNVLNCYEVNCVYDNSKFSIPIDDCVLVDINQVSSESFSEYICKKILKIDEIFENLESLNITVNEDVNKLAKYIYKINK